MGDSFNGKLTVPNDIKLTVPNDGSVSPHGGISSFSWTSSSRGMLTEKEKNETALQRVEEVREATPILHLLDRERVCNDLLNTCVMAALIGGFALESMEPLEESYLDLPIYLLAIISVHSSTCSALTSAFLYRKVNEMGDAECLDWGSKKMNQLLLKAPLMKFVVGCMAYMLKIILRTCRDLEEHKVAQVFGVCVGVMSVCSAWSIFFIIESEDTSKVSRQKKQAT